MAVMSGPPTVPGERMPPLYFAGRDDELRKCADDLRALCATGESNGLQLTIGVPGSGKTRLADEFAKRVDGQAVAGRTVSTLMISPEELANPLSLFKTVGRAIDAERGAAEIAQVDDPIANVSGGVLGTSVAVGCNTRQRGSPTLRAAGASPASRRRPRSTRSAAAIRLPPSPNRWPG